MTDISIDGDVLFQDIEPGKRDSLDQANLARVAGRDNSSDYAERGFALSYNGADNTLDVTSGGASRNHAVVRDGADAYDVFPGDATGLELPTSTGTAYVYLAIDPTSYDAIYYHIDTDQTPPADPSLFIGTVDTGAGTTSPANREPEMSARTINADRGDISGVQWVTPEDDLQTVYDNASGPVYLGPGVYEPTSTFDVVPAKPVISYLTAPQDESKAARIKNTNGLNPMVRIDGNSDGMAASNHPAIKGVFFDGANNAGRLLDIKDTTGLPRNIHIDQCVFRWNENLATWVDGGRGARFIDCYWEDIGQNSGDAAVQISGNHYFLFDNCQVVDCGEGINVNNASRGCRITNTRFANIQSGAYLSISTGSGKDEWSLTVDDCNFVYFPAAQNAISITDANSDGPVKIVNCDFDGINRNDGTATGNKAINVANTTMPGGLIVKNNSVANFTNDPEIALRDALPNTKLGGNIGQSEFRDRGTATISSGSTSVSVTHGMDADIQSLADVTVTPASDLGAATYWYTSDPTAGDGSFDINVDADPTQSVTFSWETKVGA